MDKYQVMPSLTEQEYQELKSSIANHGVQVAIEYDEDGNVLDGHHRLQICKELGIQNIPKVVKVGMDEQQKLDYALMVNTTRRQLSREQKQELIRQQLLRTPEKSDRQIAELVGVSNKTVGTQRKELESIGEIPQCDRQTADGRVYPAHRENMVGSGQLCDSHSSIGADGKIRPRKPITIYEPTENTVTAAKELAETAAPEIINAVAEGKVPVMQAHSVVSNANEVEQKEALRRLENGQASYLMDGLNQQRMEQYCQMTAEEREEAEERIRKADAEIDQKYEIIKVIDKAIGLMAGLVTEDLPQEVRIYMDNEPNFDLEIILLNLKMAQENLNVLQQEFKRSKFLKVVK